MSQSRSGNLSEGNPIPDPDNTLNHPPDPGFSANELQEFYREVVSGIQRSESLSREEQNLLTQTQSVEDLLGVLKQIHDTSRSKSKSQLERFLERFSGGLMKRLIRFSEAIETMVSSNPQIAGLLWGSIKLLLIVSLCQWPHTC